MKKLRSLLIDDEPNARMRLRRLLKEEEHIEVIGENDADIRGDLILRGITRTVTLHVRYLGQWQTPWWEDGIDKGPKTRAGFVANTTINRLDFGVSWNAPLEKEGLVVGNAVEITIDAEAILEEL